MMIEASHQAEQLLSLAQSFSCVFFSLLGLSVIVAFFSFRLVFFRWFFFCYFDVLIIITVLGSPSLSVALLQKKNRAHFFIRMCRIDIHTFSLSLYMSIPPVYSNDHTKYVIQLFRPNLHTHTHRPNDNNNDGKKSNIISFYIIVDFFFSLCCCRYTKFFVLLVSFVFVIFLCRFINVRVATCFSMLSLLWLRSVRCFLCEDKTTPTTTTKKNTRKFLVTYKSLYNKCGTRERPRRRRNETAKNRK